MAQPRTTVPAPEVTPLPFGLLSTAVVLDDLTDRKAMGIQYEPAYCGPAYDANGACVDDPDFGTITASVDDTGTATLDATGAPSGVTYTVDWGDDTGTVEVTDLDTATHAYAAPGDYTVIMRDDRLGYGATIAVTVTDAAASGPFDGEVGYSRIPSEGTAWVDGAPFSLYHLFKCAPIGSGGEQAFMDRARTALRLGEQRALERVTGRLLAADTDGVDLTPTPGTAVPLVEGLSILEGWAGSNYGGVPVIHAPRTAASVLGHRLERVSGHLETKQGAFYASGGGYDRLTGPDGGAAADAGEAWLYVTGQVVIHRAPNTEVGPIMDSAAGGRLNEWAALVERLYTSTWECITGAVLVNLYGSL